VIHGVAVSGPRPVATMPSRSASLRPRLPRLLVEHGSDRRRLPPQQAVQMSAMSVESGSYQSPTVLVLALIARTFERGITINSVWARGARGSHANVPRPPLVCVSMNSAMLGAAGMYEVVRHAQETPAGPGALSGAFPILAG
jgi:hypothetical protein